MKLFLLLVGLLGVQAAHLGQRAASECQPDQCNNENCRCFSPGTVPGGLASSDIPQVSFIKLELSLLKLAPFKITNYFLNFANLDSPHHL